MFRTKHIIAGITVGFALLLLGFVLIPEQYRIQAQVRNLDEAAVSARYVSAPLLEGMRAKEIPTVFGDLLLGYADGQANLAGILQSAEPCGDWSIDAISSESGPSMVEFRLDPQEFDDICIQALGERSSVLTRVPAEPGTLYLIRIGDEIVFSGQLPAAEDLSLESI